MLTAMLRSIFQPSLEKSSRHAGVAHTPAHINLTQNSPLKLKLDRTAAQAQAQHQHSSTHASIFPPILAHRLHCSDNRQNTRFLRRTFNFSGL
jgi:hypothetical protein